MIVNRGFCPFFSLQVDTPLFLISRKFLIALRCGKCGVQVLGLKCVICLLWGTGSAVAQSLPVIADCSYLELSILQSQELVTCASLACPVLEWFVIIQSFGSLNFDESLLLNRPVCPSEFHEKYCH